MNKADILDLCVFRLKKPGNCSHPRVVVNGQSRTLKCDACECVLDPFDFLTDIAKREKSLAYGIMALKDEHVKMAARVGKMRKLEARLRARVYRQARDPDLKRDIQELLRRM